MKRLAFETRAAATENAREITGLAVPYDTPTTIFSGWTEIIERGAAKKPEKNLPLFRDHRTPIGSVLETWDTPEGLMMRARISETPAGNETLTLLNDGAISGLSIAFVENRFSDHWDEHGDNTRTQHEIELKEISVVPFPAYTEAEVKEIRSAQTNHRKETKEMPNPNENVEAVENAMTEMRAEIQQLSREMAVIATNTRGETPHVETRSVGELLKALIAGEEGVADKLNARAAYTGGKSTDDSSLSIVPAALRNLTEVITKGNPLAAVFQHEALPSEGTMIQYVQVKANTLNVANHEEGTAVVQGKIETENKSVAIETHAGGASLTRKEVERSTINILNTTLTALAAAAADHAAATMSTKFKTFITERNADAVETPGTLEALTWKDFKNLVIETTVKMRKNACRPTVLVVDIPTFKKITDWTDNNGNPLVKLYGEGVNQVGTATVTNNIEGMRAEIFVTIIPDWHAETPNYYGNKVLGAFVDATKAIRYWSSPVVELSDTNVSNLSEMFTTYYYDAIALEFAGGLVPLKVK